MSYTLELLQQQIQYASAERIPLIIRGGGSKDFYGERNDPADAQILSTAKHRGIVAYDPDELVITVKSGTTLQELERELAKANQILPFEPPHFGKNATIGGAVASGLAGARRAYVGAVRDFILGCSLIDGKGQILNFGGRVVKNVAGYDVHKSMAGALGTLGVLNEISFKTLPAPACEQTVQLEYDALAAREKMCQLAGKPLPLSGSFWANGALFIRLSGSTAGVNAAAQQIGGEILTDRVAKNLWLAVREQMLPDFMPSENLRLWRVSVPDTAPELNITGEYCMEWNGGLRWYITAESADEIRQKAHAVGGHATLFKGDLQAGETIFSPIPIPLLHIQKRLKQVFDPYHIFNIGRLTSAF